MAAPSPSPKEQDSMKFMDPRVLVLASLFFQAILVATGNRRKYIKNKVVRLILWFSYLSAEYLATLALGVLSRAEADPKSKYTITAFWAPFLLLHFAGPDTITAYAMADNELWLRHALGMLSQGAVVGYVFYRSFTHARLNYLSLVIILAGVVKYVEKSWVLYSSSKDGYRDSLAPEPEPGRDYAKFMNDLVCKEREGWEVSIDKATDMTSSSFRVHLEANGDQRIGDAILLEKAYSFFGTFKKLFADLILSYQDRERSASYFKHLEWKDAFNTVEIELGLMFDLFYTKSSLVFSRVGACLRIFSCLCTIAALVAFPIINKNEGYPHAEVIITYILLGGAFFLELYAIFILCLSDRMMIRLKWDWTTRPKEKLPKVLSLLYGIVVPARKRWSNSMGQYNAFNHCFKYMPNRANVCRFPKKVDQLIEKHLRSRNEPVPDDLKQLIFDELKKRAEGGPKKLVQWIENYLHSRNEPIPDDLKQLILDELKERAEGGCKKLVQWIENYLHSRNEPIPDDLKRLIFDELKERAEGGAKKLVQWIEKYLPSRNEPDPDELKQLFFDELKERAKDGPKRYWKDKILVEEMKCFTENDEVQFDQSLLVWHMATDICYTNDDQPGLEASQKRKHERCKLLSDYMVHLLIMSPFMLPSGIGQIRYEDTIAEATVFLKDEENMDREKAGDMLSKVDTRYQPSEVKGDKSKSIFFDAERLVKALKGIEDVSQRWDKITQAWVDILTFAAAQCKFSDHADKLSQGGELLTHVWLLMAHFGMTDQFQITQGFIRAKLVWN